MPETFQPYAHTSAPARAGSSHRFPNSRPETASCGNGGLADDRRIVGRPWCAGPCGQPHSGLSHVTLPPPARGQVRRSGLVSARSRPDKLPRPRFFAAGLLSLGGSLPAGSPPAGAQSLSARRPSGNASRAHDRRIAVAVLPHWRRRAVAYRVGRACTALVMARYISPARRRAGLFLGGGPNTTLT